MYINFLNENGSKNCVLSFMCEFKAVGVGAMRHGWH